MDLVTFNAIAGRPYRKGAPIALITLYPPGLDEKIETCFSYVVRNLIRARKYQVPFKLIVDCPSSEVATRWRHIVAHRLGKTVSVHQRIDKPNRPASSGQQKRSRHNGGFLTMLSLTAEEVKNARPAIKHSNVMTTAFRELDKTSGMVVSTE